MYQAIPATSSGGAGSMSTALGRAQALLGGTVTAVYGTEFDTDQWYTATLVNGTAAQSTTDKSGVLSLTTTAAANSTSRIKPHGAGSFIDNLRTAKFYAVWRIKLVTSIDAQGYVACVLLNPAGSGNPGIWFGALGTESTANWGYETFDNAGANAGKAATSTAYDTTAYHTIEIWNDATTISLAVDAVVLATIVASTQGTNAVSQQLYCGNGTTAANRAINVDYMWTVTVSN